MPLTPGRRFAPETANLVADVDKDFGRSDLDASLGKDYSQAPDDRIIKAMVGTDFN